MTIDLTIRDHAETLIIKVIRRNLKVGPDTPVWVLQSLAADIATSLAAGRYFREEDNAKLH